MTSRIEHLDAETIAAFVDRTLDPAARAAAEAHLASCADCREVWVETNEMAEEVSVSPAARPRNRAWFRGWRYGSVCFGAAAALLVMIVRPWTGDSREDQMRELVAAFGQTRSTESRFTGGFSWDSPPAVSRGVADNRKASVSEVAAKFESRISGKPDQLALWNAGAARVLIGDTQGGIELLNDAVRLGPPNPELMSDVAAALIEHGRFTGDVSMFNAAVGMASRAVALKPDLVEARFNLALALEKAGKREQAVAEWRTYKSVERDSGWSLEASTRVQNLQPPKRDE